MAKLMTIILKVEPAAFGPVILKLKEMPGIAELNFDVSDSKAAETGPRASLEEIATALLMKGPASNAELRRAFVAAGYSGGPSQAYGVMHQLKKKGIAKSAGKGRFELTIKAQKSIKAHQGNGKLPGKLAPGRKRQSPGTGRNIMLAALSDAPQDRATVIEKLIQHQMSAKSISGVLYRGRQEGVIKKNGELFELTAKGKAELANG